MKHRLAAILAADLVGYSNLMGVDEEGSQTRLKLVRAEVFGPANSRERGRTFKLMGDGVLSEFASLVVTVRCAVDIQALPERSAIPEILSDHAVLRERPPLTPTPYFSPRRTPAGTSRN